MHSSNAWPRTRPQEIRNVSLRLGTLAPRRRPRSRRPRRRSGDLSPVRLSATPHPKAHSRVIRRQ